jgi:hypothetical protein
MNRRDLIEKIAPPAPPCWPDRLTWIEYLVSASQGQVCGQGEVDPVKVLVFHAGGQPTFNLRANFCSDCTPGFKAAMQAAQDCDPQFLVNLIPAKP